MVEPVRLVVPNERSDSTLRRALLTQNAAIKQLQDVVFGTVLKTESYTTITTEDGTTIRVGSD